MLRLLVEIFDGLVIGGLRKKKTPDAQSGVSPGSEKGRPRYLMGGSNIWAQRKRDMLTGNGRMNIFVL